MKYLFSKNKSEIPALNGLRALSIFLVILFHMGTILQTDNEIIKTIAQNFRTGVDLFFMLSGFLIYGGLLDENLRTSSINLKSFYLKRTLRIMPAYYICLLINFLQSKSIFKLYEKIQNPTPEQITAHEALGRSLANSWTDILYISNYFRERIFYYGWSLSIEEQFYLFVPTLCLLLLFKVKDKFRRILVLILFLLPLLIRTIYYFAGMDKFWIDTHTETRFDAIVIGMLIAELVRWQPSFFKYERPKITLILSIAFLISLGISFATRRSGGNVVFVFTFFQIAYGLLFILAQIEGSFWNKLLGLSIFKPVARVSYTMYLWHGSLLPLSIYILSQIFLAEKVGIFAFLIIGIYSLLFVFIICIPIFYITERPFLALRDYLVKRMKKKKNETMVPN